MAIQKFRPYLTLQQIMYFIELLESDTREQTQALRLKSLREFKLFTTKVELGAVNPALVSAEKQSVGAKLGLDIAENNKSPQELREEAYELWSVNPNLCTEQQLKQAALYRYECNLMSPEEEEAYEESL